MAIKAFISTDCLQYVYCLHVYTVKLHIFYLYYSLLKDGNTALDLAEKEWTNSSVVKLLTSIVSLHYNSYEGSTLENVLNKCHITVTPV